jgi:hypothetical protein
VAPKFVPSFSWLTPTEATSQRLDAFVHTVHRMMARRGIELSVAEEQLVRALPGYVTRFESTSA